MKETARPAMYKELVDFAKPLIKSHPAQISKINEIMTEAGGAVDDCGGDEIGTADIVGKAYDEISALCSLQADTPTGGGMAKTPKNAPVGEGGPLPTAPKGKKAATPPPCAPIAPPVRPITPSNTAAPSLLNTAKGKTAPALQDTAGNLVPLAIGHVIESTAAKTTLPGPFVVVAVVEDRVGSGDTLTVFELAGRDRHRVQGRYTAYQLDKFGFRVTKKIDAATLNPLKPPKTITEVSFVIDEEASKRQSTVEGAPVVVEKPVKTTRENEECMKTRELIAAWSWGIQPPNMAHIEAELKKRGVDTGALADDIDAVLDKHAANAKECEHDN